MLNSWKDIAAHLRTSVRTAQRWEVQFHLPIHRPPGTHKGPVLAFQNELNEWIQNGGAKVIAGNGAESAVARHRRCRDQIAPAMLSATRRAERMRELALEIGRRTELLQERLREAMKSQPKMNLPRVAGKNPSVSAAANISS